MTGARGTHIILKNDLIPNNKGIIIPKSTDGRLLFLLNYHGHSLIGTTDERCDLTHYPIPPKEDIDFIINELETHLGKDIDFRNNIQSSWCGIRPLVKSSPDDIDLEKLGAKKNENEN